VSRKYSLAGDLVRVGVYLFYCLGGGGGAGSAGLLLLLFATHSKPI